MYYPSWVPGAIRSARCLRLTRVIDFNKMVLVGIQRPRIGHALIRMGGCILRSRTTGIYSDFKVRPVDRIGQDHNFPLKRIFYIGVGRRDLSRKLNLVGVLKIRPVIGEIHGIEGLKVLPIFFSEAYMFLLETVVMTN